MSCCLRIHFLATMSSRSTYRGGRNQWRRSFSERPYNNGGGGHFVSGDSHFQSVRDTNLGLRQGIFSDQTPPPPHPHFRQPPLHPQFGQPPPHPHFRQPPLHPQFGQPPPHPHFRQPPPYPQFRQPPPYNRNPQFRPPSPPFVQNQAVRPRPPKPLDYRNWEHAKAVTSPDSDRFLVLSYNILADYLAISHRSKLYFHIPRHILDWQWRKKSMLFELGLWSADIMCFQEVDRFQDLEEELKVRGYSGIWKMRTGNAIDGCAIFWRTSRFKLLFEESIEFSKLGLRDNVAQICVLELLDQNQAENTAALTTSSAPRKKVVVCNIHVLYNPRRGEIKLGQVRTLLDRAHAVSKIWDDAPVVLCGDFNCTPKSPLFNFITEQKLDLCGVDRDKVSGQASAEIRAPKPYNPNPRAQTADGSIQTPSVVGGGSDVIQPSDPLSDMQKHNKDGNAEIFPSVNKLSPSQSTETVLGGSDKETKQTLGDGCNGDMGSTFFIPIDSLKESSSCLQSEGSSANQGQINKSDLTDMGQGETANATYSNHRSTSEQTESNVNKENEMKNSDDSTCPLVSNDQPSTAGCNPGMIPDSNSEIFSTELFCLTCSSADDKEDNYSTTYQNEVSSASLSNQDEATVAGESIDEDEKTFLSALHNTEGAFPPDLNQFVRSDLDASPKELGDENLDGFSPSLDSEAVDVEKNAYDPSSWTPMELATATGNEDCTFLEHPLQLRSTYAEVEDCSGTRDSNGEPLVTSYNRCFLGTVDYIWRSEGLQTVRVLAPIPKHAMQWTPGFPTKKWGSDHIALASEVAFTKP